MIWILPLGKGEMVPLKHTIDIKGKNIMVKGFKLHQMSEFKGKF